LKSTIVYSKSKKLLTHRLFRNWWPSFCDWGSAEIAAKRDRKKQK